MNSIENKKLVMLSTIAQSLYDKKGLNILVLDVRGHSSITDFVVIAEGNVDRHVSALGRGVEDALEEEGSRPAYTEGLSSGDWVVLDYIDVMVHIFGPGLRDKYQLEELWREGKVVDVKIDLSSPVN